MMPLKIDQLYAWIATEADGSEGVAAHSIGAMGLVPLVGADKERMESLRPYAESVARMTGRPIELKVFGKGTVIDRIEPE
jgi:hypothetical protein